MEILTYDTIEQFATVGDAWDRFSAQEPRYIPSFSELESELTTTGASIRVLVALKTSEIAAIACFRYRTVRKLYHLAELNLLRLPIKEASLVGSCILGQPDEDTIKELLALILNDGRFDLLDLGYVAASAAALSSAEPNEMTKLIG